MRGGALHHDGLVWNATLCRLLYSDDDNLECCIVLTLPQLHLAACLRQHSPSLQATCYWKALRGTGRQSLELACNAASSSCCLSQAGLAVTAGTPQPDAGFYSGGFKAARSPRAPLLSKWRENLAILAGNRLPGDEKVFQKLGQQLLKERQEVSSYTGCGAGVGLGLHLKLLEGSKDKQKPCQY